ncbi:MAG: rhodanese-related sulfurtransferase [Rhodococcus sp. (in: high G+C Gram-positive bacteria)]
MRDKIVHVSAPDLPAVPAVPAAELPADLSGSILLDVREDEEWRHGHAPGALHIPMSEVPSRVGEIEPDASTYVVCGVGARSARVVQYLTQIGYEAVNVDGGMHAWVAAGRPLVREDGTEARIV